MKTRWETREYCSICWTKEALTDQENNNPRLPHNEAWLATLDVPVNISKSLSPTFLNVLSAQRYAVLLRISIQNLHHGVLELIIPVQLIYSPPDGAFEMLGANVSSIENDENSCLDSWQNDDSLPSYDIE